MRTIAKYLSKNHFSKPFLKTHSTNTSLNYFSKQNIVRVIETRTITKTFSKYFQKSPPRAHIQTKASDLASN